jgi:5-methylcytosine-specific restriction endonuclease McrA
MNAATDHRYGSRRWRAVRERVLKRDLYRCQVIPGCPRAGTVCDHVQAVYPGMPDHEFFDERKLRAACRTCNLRRAQAAQFMAEMKSTPPPRPMGRPRIY